MYYNLTPIYLSSLIPQQVENMSQYNLRNAQDLRHIRARTSLYYNSFLPSTVRQWNNDSLISSSHHFRVLLYSHSKLLCFFFLYVSFISILFSILNFQILIPSYPVKVRLLSTVYVCMEENSISSAFVLILFVMYL